MELEKILKKYNLNDEKELDTILKGLQSNKPIYNKKTRIPSNSKRIRFGVISDPHIGSNKYRPDIMDDAAYNFKRRSVEFVLVPGDICEGMSGRDGHIYELDPKGIGASNQLDMATYELNKLAGVPLYAITATASHDGWFHSKGNSGLEVGTELDRRLPDFNFLGHDEQDVEIGKGLIARLVHPGGGTAYALSYKLQKYINSISGGQKPNMIFEGHYHKSIYMKYRNIHAFEAGCLQEQTTFMKKKGTPAMLGYWIIDVLGDKDKGVEKINMEFNSFYE